MSGRGRPKNPGFRYFSTETPSSFKGRGPHRGEVMLIPLCHVMRALSSPQFVLWCKRMYGFRG